MPSIIPYYEFDVFISYRHKDDKYDHWISEFVRNLQFELDTTFRNRLSIYFDSNPVDGLIETNDVDDSIKEKLKCLVFIPVISHTYCDQDSFAWAKEFKSFVGLASTDKFGLKVKLPNGNYSSRVLPVIIHDLSGDEKILCERILGSQLRGIEFVYREPGVNRPLRFNDENHTLYRNQVNKVANSVKEIISAIITSSALPETISKAEITQEKIPAIREKRSGKWKILTGIIALILLVVSGSIYILKNSGVNNSVEKSIAILPFTIDSDEQHDLMITNGLMDEIRLSLQSIKDLRVISRNSVEQYRRGIRPSTPEIGKALGVNYIVEGSIQKADKSMRLRIELIKATAKEENVWGGAYKIDLNEIRNIFELQSEIAESIVNELRIAVTPEDKERIEKQPVGNIQAFAYFQKGKEEVLKYELGSDLSIQSNAELLKNAESYFRKTLQLDSSFSEAYSGLGYCYFYDKLLYNPSYTKQETDSLRFLIERSLLYDKTNAQAYLVNSLYLKFLGNFEDALEASDKALKYNPNYWQAYHVRASFLFLTEFRENNFVRSLENFKKTIALNGGQNLANLLSEMGDLISSTTGFEDKAELLYRKAFDIDDDSAGLYFNLSLNEMNKRNWEQALVYNDIAVRIDPSFRNNDLLEQRKLAYKGSFDRGLVFFKKIIRNYEKTGNIPAGFMHRVAYMYSSSGNDSAGFWYAKAIEAYKKSIKNDTWSSKYSYYDLAGVYSFLGDRKNAYRNLETLRQLEIFPAWWLNLIKIDPLFDRIRNEDEFKKLLSELESKFKAEHERVGKWIEDNKDLFF